MHFQYQQLLSTAQQPDDLHASLTEQETVQHITLQTTAVNSQNILPTRRQECIAWLGRVQRYEVRLHLQFTLCVDFSCLFAS